MSSSRSSSSGKMAAGAHDPGKGSLTAREREVLGLLAEGLSGAQIADRLVLSPETVRTHIRNAMNKLGASTRSQAVAILGKQGVEGGSGTRDAHGTAPQGRTDNGTSGGSADSGLEQALTSALERLVSLWDVDGGMIYLVDEDGLGLRRFAQVAESDSIQPPEMLTLGEGPLGRAALDRRAQLVASSPGGGGATIAAPMLDDSRLIGVVGLVTRPSRPTGQRELLLLQALAGRFAEIVRAGGDQAPARIGRALDGFRASWATATRSH